MVGIPPTRGGEKPGPRAWHRGVVWCAISAAAVAVVVAGWLAHLAIERRAVLRAVQAAGGTLEYAEGASRPVPWLRALSGVRGEPVRAVRLVGSAKVAGVLPLMPGLHGLEALDLDGSDVSDTDLAYVGRLATLRQLWLGRTGISEHGLRRLAALNRLESLDLHGTPIGDAGMVYVGELAALKQLRLDGTTVGDAGLLHLSALASLEDLWLDGTRVTNAGLEHLRALVRLGVVHLYGTSVSRSAVVSLRSLVPSLDCVVSGRGPLRVVDCKTPGHGWQTYTEGVAGVASPEELDEIAAMADAIAKERRVGEGQKEDQGPKKVPATKSR